MSKKFKKCASNVYASKSSRNDIIDPFVGGSSTQRVVSRGKDNVNDLRMSTQTLQDLLAQRNTYAKGTDVYNELEELSSRLYAK